MQKKHILFILAGLAIVLILGYLFYIPSGSGDVNGGKVIVAAHLYVGELKASGAPIPPSVALNELIAKGLLKREDVAGFKGSEVTVYLLANTNQPGVPVLMRARLPDGHEQVLLTDGTVETR
jgi:hypothetical protein